MPWVECANPQELLDLTLMLFNPPVAHTGAGAKLPQGSASEDTTGGVELLQSRQLRVHRAWAVCLDQQRDFDGNDCVDGAENRHTTAATSQATVAAIAPETSRQCPVYEESTGIEDAGTVLVAALSQARAEAEQRGAAATVVCGSLYLVGEFLRLVEARSAVENANG
jgi:hypothetical protein